jgi:hypothetical protein
LRGQYATRGATGVALLSLFDSLMRRIVLLAACAALVAACGATLWPHSNTPAKAYAPDVYLCAVSAAKSLGYKTFLSDSNSRKFEGRKEMPGKDYVEGDQYGFANLLVIHVRSAGTGSALEITAESVSEHMQRTGHTEVPEYASDDVQSDAATIRNRCVPNQATASQ